MKKSKFTEEQIAYALRQADTGTPVGDVCRQVGVSKRPSTSGRRSSRTSVSTRCGACEGRGRPVDRRHSDQPHRAVRRGSRALSGPHENVFDDLLTTEAHTPPSA
jgi:Transposase